MTGDRTRPPPGGAAGSVDDVVHRRVLAAASVVAAVAPGALDAVVRDVAPHLPPDEVAAVAGRVRARATGVGELEPLLADPSVTEVMVNGPGRVWVERDGHLERTVVALDRPAVERLVARVLLPTGARADRSRPIADARLADGSRVHVVVPPLAVDGPCITIRRFGARRIAVDDVAAPEVAALLRRAVAERRQIVISGGAGTGKTTLLNALAAHIHTDERIVTVEDAAELRLPGRHVVRLEARAGSAEGTGEVAIRDLVRAALRMRPDRIVVGEVRGAEALDMLQALNTGHDGSLSTCHASSPGDALRRLETMVLTGADLPLRAVREQIASAVDLVVQLARRADGSRHVVAVAEVVADPEAHPRTVLVADGTGVHRPLARPPRRLVGAGPVAGVPA